MKTLDYIIVQAGGRGVRLEHLTSNKPKALVSLGGEPLLLRLMRQHPKARFIVRADYRSDVLERYLAHYASEFDYRIVNARKDGSAGGLAQAVELLPEGEPFLVLWCDLYFGSAPVLGGAHLEGHNVIGLSRTFRCRWSFQNGQLREEASDVDGVAGVFAFTSRAELPDLVDEGEFCSYLRDRRVQFSPFYLEDAYEIGTLEPYLKLSARFPMTRPFNRLSVEDGYVEKEPLDQQGRELARRERAWYSAVREYDWPFLPRVLQTEPRLRLERIHGSNLAEAELEADERAALLQQLVGNLKTVHAVTEPSGLVSVENDREALLTKTRARLDSVSDLIPLVTHEKITVNGTECLNFYRNWETVEKLLAPYLGKSRYCLIHGDATFSNTLYDPKRGRAYLVDPRGYYGDIDLYGDPDYDWAKLYYSLVGNYDQFNRKRFALEISDDVVLTISSNGWEGHEAEFFHDSGADPLKTKLLHGIIWLSLTTYVWDDYDSICAAFYKGLLEMQHAYELAR